MLLGRHSNSQSTTEQDVRQHMHACNIGRLRVARSHDDLRESLTSFFISIDGLQHCKPQRKQHNNLIIHHSVKFIQNPWLHSLMYIYYHWSTYRAASTPGQGCNLISDGRMMYSAQKPVTSYVRRLRSAFVSQKVSSVSLLTQCLFRGPLFLRPD